MIFNPRPSKIPKTIDIKINGNSLEVVNKSKFLGVIIDNCLSWKQHALYISKKIAKTIGILSIARKALNQKTLIQLYFSFIYPYLHYCNLSWGNANDNILWPIFKNQKIALRIISNTPWRSSTIPFCKKNRILRLPDIYKNSVGLFMFKFKHELLPDMFNNFFLRNDDFHTYPTRNSKKLRPPLIKTRIASIIHSVHGGKLLESVGR